MNSNINININLNINININIINIFSVAILAQVSKAGHRALIFARAVLLSRATDASTGGPRACAARLAGGRVPGDVAQA